MTLRGYMLRRSHRPVLRHVDDGSIISRQFPLRRAVVIVTSLLVLIILTN